MQKRLLSLAVLLVATTGCGLFSRPTETDPVKAAENAMAVKSLDQYAKKHGLTREQAAHELRQQTNVAAQNPPYRSLAERGTQPGTAYAVQPAAAYEPDPGPPEPDEVMNFTPGYSR